METSPRVPLSARKKRLLCIVAASALASLAWVLTDNSDTQYLGKSIEYWYDHFRWPRTAADSPNAIEAFQEMDHRAVPFLMAHVTNSRSPFRVRTTAALNGTLGKFTSFHCLTADEHRDKSLGLLSEMGINARAAIPDLLVILCDTNAPVALRFNIARTLGNIEFTPELAATITTIDRQITTGTYVQQFARLRLQLQIDHQLLQLRAKRQAKGTTGDSRE